MSVVGGRPKKNTQISLIKQQNTSNALFLPLIITCIIIRNEKLWQVRLCQLRGYSSKRILNSSSYEVNELSKPVQRSDKISFEVGRML